MKDVKQTIEYTRVTVPASMRSPYWRYFGFPADGAHNILTREKIICTLCSTAITYNKNTSNLRTHLISRHPEYLHEMHQQQQQLQNAAEESTKEEGYKEGKAMKREAAAGSSIKEEPASQRLKLNTEEAGVSETDNPLSGDDIKKSCVMVLLSDTQMNAPETMPLSADETTDYEYFNTDAVSMEEESVADDLGGVSEETTHEGLSNVETTEEMVKPLHILTNEGAKEDPIKKVNSMEMLSAMMTKDLLPFSLLQGEGIQHLFSSEQHQLDISALEHHILNDYARMRPIIDAHLVRITQQQPYSLSVECYRNVEQLELINIYINYISKEYSEYNQLISVLYETIENDESIDLNERLSALNLRHCGALITNHMECVPLTNFASQKGIPLFECVENLLTRCMDHLFAVPTVAKSFRGIRKLVKDLVDVELPALCWTCAHSKINYLQAILNNGLLDVVEHKEILDILQALLEHINPIKLTLDTIIAEPLPLCTIIRPMLNKLIEQHYWQMPTNETDHLQQAREYLIKELKNYLKNPFLNVATFFDARFPLEATNNFINLPFPSRGDIQQEICERFQELINETEVKEQQQRNITSGRNTTKSNLGSFFNRLQSSNSSSPSKSGIALEFDFYHLEPLLDFEQCPCDWWQLCAYKYKCLHKIAKYYLCVPCGVTQWPQRISSKGISADCWRQRRAALRVEHKAELFVWYLHYNRLIYDKIKMFI